LGHPILTECPPDGPRTYCAHGRRPNDQPIAPCALQVQSLIKRYAGVAALDGVDLSVAPGKLLALLGPSGCGKTTILQAIAGFVVPDGGDIRIDGRTLLPVPPERRETAMLFQHYALFPHMTVFDNIAFGLKMRRWEKADIPRAVGEAMQRLRIVDYAQRFPGQLSGGQKQRVALARAIVTRPKILLLDEPLGALDQNLREAMQVELRKLQQGLGMTSLIVTHDQKEAIALADSIAVMNVGKIEQVGAPLEVYDRPVNRFVAHFMGVENILPVTILASENGLSDVRALGVPIRRVPGSMGPVASQALLAVRAQAVDLQTGGEGIDGIVTFARTLGTDVIYEVDVAGQTLVACAHRRDDATVEMGTRVKVRLIAERCTLIASDST